MSLSYQKVRLFQVFAAPMFQVPRTKIFSTGDLHLVMSQKALIPPPQS